VQCVRVEGVSLRLDLHFKLALVLTVSVSLCGSPYANVLAKSPAVASSPEDRNEVRQLGFDPFEGKGASIMTPIANTSPIRSRSDSAAGFQPLLTEGVFPYQLDPVSAVFSAILTMAVMTYKETGKIDLQGILELMNSTDFYAGVAGSLSAGFGQKGAAKGVGKLSDFIVKKASSGGSLPYPKTAAAIKTLGNVLNGITYMVAVTGGFEYFSQFWKIATKDVPEAHKVTDFVRSSMDTKRLVAMNLLYYTVIDQNMRKRILDSVKYHRIMTFEFIATNVALYVGYQLGTFLASHYGVDNPFTAYVIKAASSASAGVLVQLVPEAFKTGVNSWLLDKKITWKTEALDENLQEIATQTLGARYPTTSVMERDLEAVYRDRDMLSSLRIQRAMADEVLQSGMVSSNIIETGFIEAISSDYEKVEEVFTYVLAQLNTLGSEDRAAQLRSMVKEGSSAAKIYKTIQNNQALLSNPKRLEQFKRVLKEAISKSKEARTDAASLQEFLSASSPELANAIH